MVNQDGWEQKQRRRRHNSWPTDQHQTTTVSLQLQRQRIINRNPKKNQEEIQKSWEEIEQNKEEIQTNMEEIHQISGRNPTGPKSSLKFPAYKIQAPESTTAN